MGSGDGVKPLETKAEKIRDQPLLFRTIYLIDCKVHLVLITPKKVGHLPVPRHQAIPAIHKEDDLVGFLDGLHHLTSDPFDEGFIRRFVKPPGVNDHERMFPPTSGSVESIPCYSRLIVDQGMPSLG